MLLLLLLPGVVTWEYNRPGAAYTHIPNMPDHFGILEAEQEPLSCATLSQCNVHKCHEIVKSDKTARFDFGSCKIHPDDFFTPDETKPLKIHSQTFQRHRPGDEFNFCTQTHSWNKENIQVKIQTWRNDLLNNRFHQWHKDPADLPLDPENPVIKIFVNILSNRAGIRNTRFQIRGHDGRRTLLTGSMVNGVIGERVPVEVAQLEDWRLPISIFIFSPTEISVNGGEDETPLLIISGQLHYGKLHGLVVVDGVLSNSQDDQCSDVPFKGAGFVANFKDGIPTGLAWKQLPGKAWIYGQTDENGDLTGNLQKNCKQWQTMDIRSIA